MNSGAIVEDTYTELWRGPGAAGWIDVVVVVVMGDSELLWGRRSLHLRKCEDVEWENGRRRWRYQYRELERFIKAYVSVPALGDASEAGVKEKAWLGLVATLKGEIDKNKRQQQQRRVNENLGESGRTLELCQMRIPLRKRMSMTIVTLEQAHGIPEEYQAAQRAQDMGMGKRITAANGLLALLNFSDLRGYLMSLDSYKAVIEETRRGIGAKNWSKAPGTKRKLHLALLAPYLAIGKPGNTTASN
ncbi:hypothetical protein BDZ91DRAFT_783887 [Kalaharituber pfeilii]|nr:hypothetical protein BDZ91DRAFT_783887 [Kalaharituber pfeilii]